MGVKAEALTGGFSDAVFDSQRIFKELMDGMARPGTAQTIETTVAPPLPLGAASGAVLLALCDHDTPVWLSGALRKTTVPGWIGFHTGAVTTEEKARRISPSLRREAQLPPSVSLPKAVRNTPTVPRRSSLNCPILTADGNCCCPAPASAISTSLAHPACRTYSRGYGRKTTPSSRAASTSS